MTPRILENELPLSISAVLRSDDSGRTVAFGVGGPESLDDFRRRVLSLAGRLGDGRRRYLVHCEDAYAFAVTLAALAVSANVGVLAPNDSPGTLAELAGDTAGFIGDNGAENAIAPLAAVASADVCTADFELDSERPLVEMFTSGSSGGRDKVVKTLAHLESEVRVLERTFGASAGSSAVFATVSPQHLYGLLFRVLWPLIAGRAFQRETLLRPEELAARIAEADAAVLVGTPTHLRILAASPALGAAASKLRSVFSSGGPLAFETAAAMQRSIGVVPTEIFGSTETGGIAHRLRRSDDTPWILLDGVQIEIEPEADSGAESTTGRLVVTSPFVSVGSRAGDANTMRFATGDRVIRVSTEPVLTFALAGRADRVVQIAEKRISLPELEKRVLEHPFVVEAAAAAVEIQGTTRLGALIVLSREGRLALAERGRASLCAELAQRLVPFYDRVALPRRWRFVHALPRDAQGKVGAEAVARALTHRLAESNTEPVLLEDSSEGASIERRCVVPKDLAFLEGHFDRFPLVAGVVQLKWAVDATAEMLGEGAPMPSAKSVKFRQVLRPLQEFTFRVTLDTDAGHADFSLTDGDREFSSGRLAVKPT